MTPKISLITAVAVGVVAIGAPAALSEGRLAGSQEPSAAVAAEMGKHGFDRAVAAQTASWMAEDGFDTAVETFEHGRTITRTEKLAPDDRFNRSVEEKLALEPSGSTYLLGRTGGARSDRGDTIGHTTPAPQAVVATTTPGSGIEWPQIVAGFGVGLALALGLVLGRLWLMRVRPVVH